MLHAYHKIFVKVETVDINACYILGKTRAQALVKPKPRKSISAKFSKKNQRKFIYVKVSPPKVSLIMKIKMRWT